MHVHVMKVNKMPFLITISCAIKFRTVAFLKNAKITGNYVGNQGRPKST